MYGQNRQIIQLRKTLRVSGLSFDIESEVEITDRFKNETDDIVILHHKRRAYSKEALKVRGIVVDLINERVILKSLIRIKKVTSDILRYTDGKLFLNTLEPKSYILDVSILRIVAYINGFFIRTFLQNDVMFIVTNTDFINVTKVDRSLLYPNFINSPISYKFYIVENSLINASKVPASKVSILNETLIIPFGENYLWSYSDIPDFLDIIDFHIDPYIFNTDTLYNKLENLTLPEANQFLSSGYSWQGEAVLLVYGKKLFLVKSNDYLYRESLFSLTEFSATEISITEVYKIYINMLGTYNFLDINDINLFFTKYESIELPNGPNGPKKVMTDYLNGEDDIVELIIEPEWKNRREVMSEYFTEKIPFTYSKYLWYILFLNSPIHYIEEIIDLHDRFREDLDKLTEWIYSIYLGKEINLEMDRKTDIKLKSILFDIGLKGGNKEQVMRNIDLEINDLYPHYLSRLIHLSK